MEPVTHLLFGAALGRAGLNRTTALATLTTTLAAESPDIDIVANLFGDVTGFAHHRGITHTFLGAPFIAALTLGAVYGIHRVRRRWRRAPRPGAPLEAQQRWREPRWGLLYLYACLAALSHILLDFTNSYGVRPLSPMHHQWYSWDIVFVIEPVMLAMLAAGLALPSLFGLVQEEIGARRRGPRGRAGALLALALVAGMWGVRDHYHRRAVAILESFHYGGQPPLRVAAYPYWVDPFTWYAVVETEDAFHTSNVDARRGEFDSRLTRVRYKPEETPVTLAAKRSRLGQVYLDWAAFPVAEQVAMPGGGHLVRLVDLRFDYPGRRGPPPLAAAVVLDAELNVVEQQRRWRAAGAELDLPGGAGRR